MSETPKNIREVNIAAAGLKSRTRLTLTTLWILIGFLGAIFACAAAIYVQLATVGTDVVLSMTADVLVPLIVIAASVGVVAAAMWCGHRS